MTHRVNGTPVSPVDKVLPRLSGVEQVRTRRDFTSTYKALCPVHDDHDPSLEVGVDATGKVLILCRVCGKEATPRIVEAIGLKLSDLFPPDPHRNGNGAVKRTYYDYSDADGRLLYQVMRVEPGMKARKDFFQRRPDGNGGWIKNLKGVPRVLYRLPELSKTPVGEPVFIAEGEKCVHALVNLGLTATCNSGGAEKFPNDPGYVQPLAGRTVFILPDNDEPGNRHGRQVLGIMQRAKITAKIVELPGLAEKEDVADWISRGGTKEQLLELCRRKPADPDRDEPLHDGCGGDGHGQEDETTEDSQSDEIKLGNLLLKPDKPRQTPSGKITMPVWFYRGGKVLDQFIFSNSASGRLVAARLLRSKVGNESDGEVSTVVNSLATLAAEQISTQEPESREGQTVRQIVSAKVPEEMGINCRTEAGLWSSVLRREINRSEFIQTTPGWLLDAAAEAVDAPRDQAGQVVETGLLKAVTAALQVLWPDLRDPRGRLPAAADATFSRGEEGDRFRNAMILLWTKTVTFQVTKPTDGANGEAVAARASLISRVRSQRESKKIPEAEKYRKWHEVQNAFSAWWRLHTAEDGEESVLLAMRWELCHQIGVMLPGVCDQTSLTNMGTQLGVLSDTLPVTDRLSGGRRLAVLSLDLTHELLEQPPEDDLSDASDTESPVTEEKFHNEEAF